MNNRSVIVARAACPGILQRNPALRSPSALIHSISRLSAGVPCSRTQMSTQAVAKFGWHCPRMAANRFQPTLRFFFLWPLRIWRTRRIRSPFHAVWRPGSFPPHAGCKNSFLLNHSEEKSAGTSRTLECQSMPSSARTVAILFLAIPNPRTRSKVGNARKIEYELDVPAYISPPKKNNAQTADLKHVKDNQEPLRCE